jgi:SAM-dependent methyltransferase
MIFAMGSVLLCPICEGPTKLLSFGVVAPWILVLWGRDPKKLVSTQLRTCHICQLSFFSYRYSKQEVKQIYENYRESDWFRNRNFFEPWYRKGTNEAYVDNQKNIASRMKFTSSLITSAGINLAQISSFLDFGGDSGQFFPLDFRGKKILFDIQSHSQSMKDGVYRVSSLHDLAGSIDMVTNCYVLEHMSDINNGVIELKKCLKRNGFLLVELPYDRFKVSRFHRTSLYRTYLSVLYRSLILFRLIDFVTGVYRQFFNKIPFFGVVKQSEHINYFDDLAIVKLIQDHNFEILYSSKPQRKSFVGIIKQGRFGIVAQKL